MMKQVLGVAVAPFVLLFCGLVLVGVYRVTLHPLSRVPGPRLAALSNVWYAYQVRNGRAAHLGRTIHLKYGPVVRVGPNEVWMNSKLAFKTIYSATRYTTPSLKLASL